MKKTVLLVDGDQKIRAIISENLISSGYNVIETSGGEDALEIIFNKKSSIDLIILEAVLSGIDGFTVLERARECFDTPIIILTAVNDDKEQIRAFKLGADDYVIKPPNVCVLSARIQRLLKGSKKENSLFLGSIEIAQSEREIYLNKKPIKMTPKEYELLKYLILNKGIALSRERILNAVWNYDYLGDLRTVDTHIKQLRAKLKKSGAEIITVRNIGYKMIEK